MISNKSEECPRTFDVITVLICPASREEYDKAALKKQCSQLASKRNCSDSSEFKYHCVISSYRNKFFEVCAPEKNIFGKSKDLHYSKHSEAVDKYYLLSVLILF